MKLMRLKIKCIVFVLFSFENMSKVSQMISFCLFVLRSVPSSLELELFMWECEDFIKTDLEECDT